MLKKENKKIFSNKNYWIFQWLWLIVLFPKSVQLIIYLIILVSFIFYNGDLKFNRFSIFLIAYATVHLVSIIINIFRYDFETDRILAALNTCALWYLGSAIYSYYRSINLSRDNYARIFKTIYIDCWILIIIYFVTKILSIESINLIYDNITIWSADWIFNEYSLRFSSGLGYPTLVSEFTLIFFPFSILYLTEYRKRNYVLICVFTLFMALTNYACHSRVGMVLFAIELIVTLYYIMSLTKFYRQAKRIMVIVVFVVILLVLLFYGNDIYEYVLNLFNSREDSNNTRLLIYITSIEKTWTESPLIGLGVKTQLGNYPLGSHSTYIGVFYKTGIIGSVFFIIAFIMFICEQWCNSKKTKYGKFMFFTFLLYLVMLCLEDLDGYDWLIVSYFAVIGVYSSYIRQITSKKGFPLLK